MFMLGGGETLIQGRNNKNSRNRSYWKQYAQGKGSKREGKRLYLPVMKHIHMENKGKFLFIYLNLGESQ